MHISSNIKSAVIVLAGAVISVSTLFLPTGTPAYAMGTTSQEYDKSTQRYAQPTTEEEKAATSASSAGMGSRCALISPYASISQDSSEVFPLGTTYSWSRNGSSLYAHNPDGSIYMQALNARTLGIDVSEWNGYINWSAVKASGVDSAIIRCGYGGNYYEQDDDQWLNNAGNARAAGVNIGVYIYSYATDYSKLDSEIAHVDRCLSAAGLNPANVTYPIYIDIEDSSQSGLSAATLQSFASRFCQHFTAQGYRSGVYASLSWWNNKLAGAPTDPYSHWVAQWNPYIVYDQYGGSTDIWQTMSDGSVPGISGRVDMDAFYILPSNHVHSYSSSITKKPTCTTSGEKTSSCICGAFYIEPIAPTGHSYVKLISQPTCTEMGHISYRCSVCGDSYIDSYVSPLGHYYSEKSRTLPTCTQPGQIVYSCSRCADEMTAENGSPLGHDFSQHRQVSGQSVLGCSRCEEYLPLLTSSKYCTVVFTDGFGTTLKTEVVEEGYSATAPSTPTKEGRKFLSWDKSFSSITGDTTITAIWKTSMTLSNISAIPNQKWSGMKICPQTKVVIDGKTLKEGTDYSISYSNNAEPGTAYATITGIGDYYGSKQTKFIIGESMSFADVVATTPHQSDVMWLASTGISTGWKRGTLNYFEPASFVLRADMAAFLYRVAGSPSFDESSVRNPFNDVSTSTPHYKEILWCYATGITTGYGSGSKMSFQPFTPVYRQDMAAFLRRTSKAISGSDKEGSAVISFVDVSSSTPHSSDIAWLGKSGITTGYKDGSKTYYKPTEVVYRQDMAAFLHRLSTFSRS